MARARKINPGKPLPRRLTPAEIIRLLKRVEVSKEPPPNGFQTPCWLWGGHTDSQGYGQIKLMGQARWVQRVSVEVFVGQLGSDEADHKCHNPRCLNPEHIAGEPVSVNRHRRKPKPELEAAPF